MHWGHFKKFFVKSHILDHPEPLSLTSKLHCYSGFWRKNQFRETFKKFQDWFIFLFPEPCYPSRELWSFWGRLGIRFIVCANLQCDWKIFSWVHIIFLWEALDLWAYSCLGIGAGAINFHGNQNYICLKDL